MKRKRFKRVKIDDRLRMIRIMDSLSGRKIVRTCKTILTVLSTILIIGIVYLFLQTLGLIETKNILDKSNVAVDVFASTELDKTTIANTYNPKDIIDVLIGVITVFVTAVTAFQVYMMKDIDHMEMSHKIYKDNQEYRQKMEKAQKQMKKLAEDLKESHNFNEIYIKDEYAELRAMAFHYEYIGYLVFRNRLNFDIVFDTITFPNWLISSNDAAIIIKEGRKDIPDFWNGAEHLYCTYEVKRKYNNLKNLDDLSQKKIAKIEYKKARDNWEKHFCKLPN